MLNSFFASCWNTSKLPISEEAYSTHSSFGDLTVTPDEVFHLINILDTNKANGPDNISAFMLLKQLQRALQNHWLDCSHFRYQQVNSQNCGKLQALCQFQSPLVKVKATQLSIPIRKLPGAHKVVTTLQGCDNLVTTLSQPCHNLTRLSQPCHNLVIGLSVPYKVVTTLSQPCNRIVSTLQGCDNLVTTLY